MVDVDVARIGDRLGVVHRHPLTGHPRIAVRLSQRPGPVLRDEDIVAGVAAVAVVVPPMREQRPVIPLVALGGDLQRLDARGQLGWIHGDRERGRGTELLRDLRPRPRGDTGGRFIDEAGHVLAAGGEHQRKQEGETGSTHGASS
jgi:hypothetical protein